jgi:hypothetical protein
MGEKGDNFLYGILPLILIIAVSWFFSFLSAKARKQTQQDPRQPQTQTQPEKDALELFFGADEDAEFRKSSQRLPEQAVPRADPGTTLGKPHAPDARVTPKPIEPKWWGA